MTVRPAAVLLGGMHDGYELAVMPTTERIIVTPAAPAWRSSPGLAVAAVDDDARPRTPEEVLYIRGGRMTRESVPVYEYARPAPT